MDISLLGLGYVGTVCAACLSNEGHKVIGVDVNQGKIDAIQAGESPILEPGLDELVEAAAKSGMLTATADVYKAVTESEITIISVGTPCRPSGIVDLRYVLGAIRDIGAAVKDKQAGHVIILRSTVTPGTSKRCHRILMEMTGRDDVHLLFYPEFLRESTAIEDYQDPDITVVGSMNGYIPKQAQAIWKDKPGQHFMVDWEVSELVKYTANTFHAMKISYANEVGRVANAYHVDGQEIMEILCADTTLNVSKAYLRPGFAFGGSCLPKDLRALTAEANMLGVDVPLMHGIQRSNAAHISASLKKIRSVISLSGVESNVLLIGIAFKTGTDDLRESPSVELSERLLLEGANLSIYDPYVPADKLVGTNRIFADAELPELAAMMTDDLAAAVKENSVIVVAQADKSTADALESLVESRHVIIDLGGSMRSIEGNDNYYGIGW